jgi:gamma-butyrobetaine dioxygenase
LIMNNYRTLHGRTSYNTSEGSRWLQGLYIDHDSAESKYKLLANG